MKKYSKLGLGILLAAAIVAATGWALHGHVVSVLQPAGEVSTKERNLIAFCAALSLVVVVPVFGLLVYICVKYREDNTKAKYEPDSGGNPLAETIWWIIPGILLVIIATITWRSSYAMDPFKPLASSKKTLHVQVVALDWKWLFIYPGQKVASVNEAAIPVGTPVDFEITSDAVMSSFWAPQLGGQMYAMTGMTTHLNLNATKPGDYRGVSANINGKGFAGMSFTIKAVSDSGFQGWMHTARSSMQNLTPDTYNALARPSENVKPAYYAHVTSGLYDTIVMKYMMPTVPKTNTAPSASGVSF